MEAGAWRSGSTGQDVKVVELTYDRHTGGTLDDVGRFDDDPGFEGCKLDRAEESGFYLQWKRAWVGPFLTREEAADAGRMLARKLGVGPLGGS